MKVIIYISDIIYATGIETCINRLENGLITSISQSSKDKISPGNNLMIITDDIDAIKYWNENISSSNIHVVLILESDTSIRRSKHTLLGLAKSKGNISISSRTVVHDELEIILKKIGSGNKHYCQSFLEILIGNIDAEEELTEREIEVLKLVCRGKTSKDIGLELFVSEHTVSSHRRNIMHKLKLNSPIELINYAIENGYYT